MPRTYTSVDDGDIDDPDAWHTAYSITSLVQGSKTFSVSGDRTGDILVGDSVVVAGSTGNNGTYTVVSATFASSHTAIVVLEAISNAVADGTIQSQALPTTGDSLVVEDHINLGSTSLSINDISGSGQFTIPSGGTLTAVTSSVDTVVLAGTLLGAPLLTVSDGAISYSAGGVLGGNVRLLAGCGIGSASPMTFGTDGTIDVYISPVMGAVVNVSGTIRIYGPNNIDIPSAVGTATVKLMDKRASITIADTTTSYDGPTGVSSMRMGL